MRVSLVQLLNETPILEMNIWKQIRLANHCWRMFCIANMDSIHAVDGSADEYDDKVMCIRRLQNSFLCPMNVICLCGNYTKVDDTDTAGALAYSNGGPSLHMFCLFHSLVYSKYVSIMEKLNVFKFCQILAL